MPTVRFYGTCNVAGADMWDEVEYDELPSEEQLTLEADEMAREYYAVEGWYEIVEDEDDDDSDT